MIIQVSNGYWFIQLATIVALNHALKCKFM